MKKDIHPKYNIEAKATCVCGAVFFIGSLSDINIEICSKCHPFFSNSEKIIDKAGRVERFKKRQEATLKSGLTGKK